MLNQVKSGLTSLACSTHGWVLWVVMCCLLIYILVRHQAIDVSIKVFNLCTALPDFELHVVVIIG